jgi:hypothetical protein
MKTDRLWLWLALTVWIAMAVCLWWRINVSWNWADWFGPIFLGLLWGGLGMLYFVGIPLRIILNLVVKERQRERLRETIMCIIAFLSMTLIFFLAILNCPPGW